MLVNHAPQPSHICSLIINKGMDLLWLIVQFMVDCLLSGSWLIADCSVRFIADCHKHTQLLIVRRCEDDGWFSNQSKYKILSASCKHNFWKFAQCLDLQLPTKSKHFATLLRNPPEVHSNSKQMRIFFISKFFVAPGGHPHDVWRTKAVCLSDVMTIILQKLF